MCHYNPVTYKLNKDGFQIVPSDLTKTEIEVQRSALSSLKSAPGHRSLIQRVQVIAALAASSKILDLLDELLGAEPFLVRSIFFDKTPDANWLVPWHQDVSVAVKKRHDRPGYGP